MGVIWSFAVSMTALPNPAGEPFAPSSDGDKGLTRVDPESSGLRLSSQYRDPRAWNERLQPATIGTVGTGIGVGDFDGDEYPDLFVAMREGRNRLYLNKGPEGFVDRTEEAGIRESLDWTTGVTVVDLDGNGKPDIYVCFFDSPNRLYLNYGDMKFEEAAEKLGLDVQDACSGSFFADYDKDGDLDLYLQTNVGAGRIAGGRPDYFFRNDGENGFVDVTEEVGILNGEAGKTLGHSVLWVDFDEDGWEDLYVANDFKAPDFLYLNNGDGTFRFAPESIPMAPYSSMGSDLGDVTGNGKLDILTTDMATPSYRKHVESMLTSAVKTRELSLDSRPRQTMKNALLLNRGRGDYVDVAYAWDIAATDWTWAPRLVDLDNDGWQDAFFTNGMIRQFHNADLALAQDRQMTTAAKTAVFQRSPVLKEPNLVFRNRDGRGFELVNDSWGYQHEGVSFGTALLDFDRDGDLDIVYTNYEAPPSLWRNDLGSGNAVQVRLVGEAANREAVGAIATAHFGGRKQSFKILSNRGYLGTDEKLLHIGLGEEEAVEKLEIVWPDGTIQAANHLEGGKRYTIQKASSEAPREEYRSDVKSRFKLTRLEEAPTPNPFVHSGAGRMALLYPFKPLPTPAKPRLIQEDFDGDGQRDSLILRDWATPRIVLSESESNPSGDLDSMSGLWELALVDDFNGDNRLDIFLGGLGINNEISYRSSGEGKLVRHLGRFSSEGPEVNLNAYEWEGELRLYDGLRDYSDIEGTILRRIRSFRETGQLTADAYRERLDFKVARRFEIDRFQSGLLVNSETEGFRFEPLPLEAQYGRVWDAGKVDVNGDAIPDLVLLLGQVSPHYRSAQNECSFISLFLGQGDGRFVADSTAPLDRSPEGRMVSLSLIQKTDTVELEVLLEEGSREIFELVQ